MIIYFTGTGNSRHMAEILAKELLDDIVDAAGSIKKGEYPAFYSKKPYVFVAPTYAWRLPRVFEDWIRKCTFEGSKQAYFVLNCGSDIGAAAKYAEKLCADIGFSCMGMAEVVMPENYIAVFSAPSPEKAERIIARADEETRNVVSQIAAGHSLEIVKISPIGRLCSDVVNPLFYKFTIGAKNFYVTDKCISCGQCVEHCMLNNVSLKDGKPIWGENCTHCMACICKCPTEAIEYGKHTKGLRRYSL